MPGLLPAAAHAEHATGLLFGLACSRDVLTGVGKRVFKDRRGHARLDRFEQSFELRRRQRGGLNHEQSVVDAGTDRSLQADLFDLVLLAQLVDQRVLFDRSHLHAGHRHAAHQLGIGADDADTFSLAACNGVDRSNQFVLDRNSVLENRHDDLFQAGPERGPHDDSFLLIRTLLANHSRDRLDPETVGSLGGFVAEQINFIKQIDFDRSSAGGRFALKLFQ